MPSTPRTLVAVAFAAIVIGSMLWPADAEAQRRRIVRRVPARTSIVVGVRPFYYRPWFYDPWYASPYGFYQPYPYYGRAYADASSLRLQVQPKETEVFIDGYWAGTVDDFDGFFQRLRLEPGEHEIELYLDGHRGMRQKIYVQPGATFRIRHTMAPLAAGETPDPRPSAPAGPPPPRDRYDARGRPERERTERADPPIRGERGSFGTLAVRVQPEGAEVLIDGESWTGPGAAEGLIVELPEGEHRVEVREDGFTTYASTVRVRPGETTTLNVSLARE